MSTAATASPEYLAETKQPWVIATVAAVGALAFVSVALRMLARWVKKAPLGLDDYFILLSMGWFLVVIGFISGSMTSGPVPTQWNSMTDMASFSDTLRNGTPC